MYVRGECWWSGVDVAIAPRLKCPSDSKSSCFESAAVLTTQTLLYLWFSLVCSSTVTTDTSSAEAGAHNKEALYFGSCCNTKYSNNSAVARARPICPRREDYKPRLWKCPAEPPLTLWKGQVSERACKVTPLLNSSL